MRWTLLVDSPRPGWENMALDSALLDAAAGEGGMFLRLYRWEPHCLSFGRHEPALERYDAERIRALTLDCVRRPTGGRAVWHARELTYAVAAPLALFGGLQPAYATIHQVLAAALGALGARALLAPRPAVSQGPGAGPCFAASVGGEVLIEGKKVVGSAQLRREQSFLQHGSLLLEDDQALVRSLARMPDTAAGADAPLSRLLRRPVEFDEAAAAVIAAATAAWGVPERPRQPPPEILAAAARHAEGFRSPRWTWQR